MQQCNSTSAFCYFRDDSSVRERSYATRLNLTGLDLAFELEVAWLFFDQHANNDPWTASTKRHHNPDNRYRNAMHGPRPVVYRHARAPSSVAVVHHDQWQAVMMMCKQARTAEQEASCHDTIKCYEYYAHPCLVL
jgi:hypothetical protein